jgi:hypothetical protein
MPVLAHFLITRFNVRSSGALSGVSSRPHWLDRRIGLFERYCLPSVQSQSRTDFNWLLYFDAETPQPYRAIFESYGKLKNVIPVYLGRNEFRGERIRADILGHIDDSTTHILTTRLDNDDAISRDFVEILREHVHTTEKRAYNFRIGLVLHEGKTYATRDPSNAFISLCEPLEDFGTVWRTQHTDLRHIAPVRQIDGPATWLQVVHDMNVKNRVKGRRVPLCESLKDFEIDLGEVPDETRHAILLDNLLAYPVRVAGELARQGAKAILGVRQVGKFRRAIVAISTTRRGKT